jgi:1-deoxy-D-xylulose-5-phosphate reductoisomerase
VEGRLVAGDGAPIVLNAANEVAVELFLAKHIKFNDISAMVDRALQSFSGDSPADLESVLEIDRATRTQTRAAPADCA